MVFGDNIFERFGKVYRPGNIIFCEYEPGDDFYLIQSGHVRITKVVSDKEKMLDVLGPSDIFGEMAILEQQPRSATAVAQDEVKALVFNRQNFELLLKSNPEIAIKLLKTFAKRIYDAKRQLMVLTFTEHDIRMADVFILLAEKAGMMTGGVSKIELRVTKEDLLNLSGLPEKDLDKILETFKLQHKIEVLADRIVIMNIKEFERTVSLKRKQRTGS
jgi:CRP/FNR family transcriptional regulator, cyclic AMP receptor protein